MKSSDFIKESGMGWYAYFLLMAFQMLLLALSAMYRRQAWRYSEADERLLPSPELTASTWLFWMWLSSVLIAGLWGVFDGKRRTEIFLFLVIIFPSIEFFAWLFWSF